MKQVVCPDSERHTARRRAETEVETWLVDYADEHGLSSIDLLVVLVAVSQMLLRYVDRDEEEQRTGFRHRMPGE